MSEDGVDFLPDCAFWRTADAILRGCPPGHDVYFVLLMHMEPAQVNSYFVYFFMHLIQLDISSSMAYLMAPKDDSEIATIKKACQATSDLFNKFLKEQLMDLIDKDKVQYQLMWTALLDTVPTYKSESHSSLNSAVKYCCLQMCELSGRLHRGWDLTVLCQRHWRDEW